MMATLASTIRRTIDMEKVLTLNIGGTKFTTVAGTLLKQPMHPCLFDHILSGKHTLPLDEDKNLFIDRSPRLFEYILDFHRSGTSVIPADCVKAMRFELKYFKLNIDIAIATPDRRTLRWGGARRLYPHPNEEQLPDSVDVGVDVGDWCFRHGYSLDADNKMCYPKENDDAFFMLKWADDNRWSLEAKLLNVELPEFWAKDEWSTDEAILL